MAVTLPSRNSSMRNMDHHTGRARASSSPVPDRRTGPSAGTSGLHHGSRQLDRRRAWLAPAAGAEQVEDQAEDVAGLDPVAGEARLGADHERPVVVAAGQPTVGA